MIWPRIELKSPGPLANTQIILPIDYVCYMCVTETAAQRKLQIGTKDHFSIYIILIGLGSSALVRQLV